MALKVAFQMDPIERIDIRGDSTFALLLEAQWRGHDVFYYTPANLSLRDGKLMAEGHSLTVEDRPGDHYRLAHPRTVDLAEFDVVHLRQDPPFDMAYITTTHLLERMQPNTLVVNDPGSRAQRAGEGLRARLSRSHAADPRHPLAGADPRLPRQAQGHRGEAALRQWRRRDLPHRARRHQSQLADRADGHDLPRADHGAALHSGGAQGRQAHHPGRRRVGRRHQPRAGAGRKRARTCMSAARPSPPRSPSATRRSARGSGQSSRSAG